MGLTKKSDGRYVVGKGIEDGNEYKGSAAWRDMVIQYSGDGATEKSLEYLTFLKDYALYHSAQGNPVIPPNVQIWMSTANTMKAVEADDITVDGDTVKIGACTWDGSDWSFAEPTPGGGGSSLPAYTAADKGKFLGLGDGEPVETEVTVIPEQTLTFTNIGRPDTPQYAATIAAPNFTGLSNGQDVTVYIDGTAYTCTYSSDQDQITGEGDVYEISDTWYFEITLEGTWTGSHTISSEAITSVPTVTPKWEAVQCKVYPVTLPDDLQTSMFSALAPRISAAISAGVGVPTFTGVAMDITPTDNDGFDSFYNSLKTAGENNGIVVLVGGTACSLTRYDNVSDSAVIYFRYPAYEYDPYVFDVDIVLVASKFGNTRKYGVGSTITLIYTMSQ